MKKVKKIFSIIYLIIRIVAITFITIFIAFVLLQRFSNNKFSVGGYRLFSVVTNSMAPKYVAGDILLTKSVSAENITKGDDISYIGNNGSYSGKIITHRVLAKEKQDNGKYILQTKGINNVSADPIITEDQIVGKVVTRIYLLSLINQTIQTSTGFFLCIFIPLIIIIGSELISKGVENYQKKKEKYIK